MPGAFTAGDAASAGAETRGRRPQALSPDGVLAATGSGDGTVRVCTLADGCVWDEIDCTDSGVVTHMTWLPRAGGARPLLVTANYNVRQDLSRVMVRAAWHAG